MKWITPVDPGYDESRTLFNAMIDRRPAVIAPCRTPADVAEALKYARDHSLAVAVRAGGHSVAGMSLNDAAWWSPQGGQEAKARVKRFRGNIAPYATGGVWLNFIGDDGQQRVRAAFGGRTTTGWPG